MATENTAVETQADENTENENTIAEENQKKIDLGNLEKFHLGN